MKPGYLRIGLIGSSCSGKTTTATLLSQRLNIELHEEVESALLKRWIANGKIRSKGDFVPDLSAEFHEEALKIRERNVRNILSFVTDRTAAELFVYYLLYVSPHVPKAESEKFRERCLNVMSVYTHLFLFPLGSLPLKNNAVRTVNREYQSGVHQLIVRVLEEFQLDYINLSSQKLSRGKRLEEILKWLEA